MSIRAYQFGFIYPRVSSIVPAVTRRVPATTLLETLSFRNNMAMIAAKRGVVDAKGATTLALAVSNPM